MMLTPDIYRYIFNNIGDGLIINDIGTGCIVEANPIAAAMHGYAYEAFIGLHSTGYLYNDQHAVNADGQTLQLSPVFEGLAVHIHHDKSLFYVELRKTFIMYEDRPCVLSVIRDVSQRVAGEQVLRRLVETRTREQAILLEISQTLASALELNPGLILDQLRKIIEYTHAGLFVIKGAELVALAIRGPAPLLPAEDLNLRMTMPKPMLDRFNISLPLRFADTSFGDMSIIDSREKFIPLFFMDQADAMQEKLRSWMWISVAVKGRIIGRIGVGHTKSDHFTTHHADLALIVANQAAITMVNAELYEHAQALSALRERQRLAQELHDAVNQSLFSAGLIAEVLPRLWERDIAAGRRSLEDLRRLTRGALAEMRLLLVELRPSALTDNGLSDLLNLLGKAFTGRTNTPVTVSIIGQVILPANVQVAFYRLCQEGLNNIAKHAAATQVEIQLQNNMDSATVDLHIRDNGCGFDLKCISAGHYGLSMMHERAEAIGAVLSINSQPGHGTDISLCWAKVLAKKEQS